MEGIVRSVAVEPPVFTTPLDEDDLVNISIKVTFDSESLVKFIKDNSDKPLSDWSIIYTDAAGNNTEISADQIEELRNAGYTAIPLGPLTFALAYSENE